LPSVEQMRIDLMRAELLEYDKEINPFKYIDLMPHQSKFFEDLKLFNAIFGGNRSGKTFTSAYFCISQMRKRKVWIIASTWQAISKTVQQKTVYELLPKNGEFEFSWTDERGFLHNMIKHKKTGAVMMFRTYDQRQAKHQGTNPDIIWDDEEPPKSVWDEQKMRIVDKGGLILLSMTPVNGMTYIYDEIVANQDVKNVKFEYFASKENEYINQEVLESVLSNYDVKQALTRSEGVFQELKSGIVYYAFDSKQNIIGEYDRATKCTNDGKFRYDPTAILKLSCDFNVGLMSWNICQEHNGIDYVFDYIELENYASTELMCQLFKQIYGNHPKHLLYVYPDRTGEARHTDAARSNIEIISQELGINYNTQIKSSVIKNKMDRVAATNARFYNSGKQRQLFICKNMKRLISDLQRVTWEHLDRMRLKDEDRLLTHSSDALSYQIYYEHPLIPLPTTTIRYK
jgi:phage terminase large subunit-like protein